MVDRGIEPRFDEEMDKLRVSRDAAMHAARSAVRDATRLTRLLTILSEADELDVMLERSIDVLSELFFSDIVVLLDPAGLGSYSPLASLGLPDDMHNCPFLPTMPGNIDQAMRTRKVLQIQGRGNAALEAQFLELGVSTVVYVPVIASYEPRGVLMLARIEDMAFEVADIGLLRTMAHRIGLTIEQAQRRKQLEQIAFSSRQINLATSDDLILEKAVEMLPGLIGADGALFLASGADGPQDRRWQPRIAKSVRLPSGAQLGALKFALDRAARQGRLKPFNEPKAGETDGALDDWALCGAPDGWGGVLILPIGLNKLEGVLIAVREHEIAFDPDLQQIAMLYAQRVSNVLEINRLYNAANSELEDRRKAESALKVSEERLAALIRSVNDLIIVLDEQEHVQFTNPAAAAVWPRSQHRPYCPEDFWRRVAERDRESLKAHLADLRTMPGATRTTSLSLVDTQGKRHDYDVVITNLLEDPAVGGFVLTLHDITVRKLYARELEALAFVDPLTGLANRARFLDALQALMEGDAIARERDVTVIFFDLDNFKIVNDSLGHEAGDAVLCEVASRVRQVLDTGDLAARLGGDEFTLLLAEGTDLTTARTVAGRLLEAVKRPIRVAGHHVQVGGSFGIAQGQAGLDTAENLLRKADIAMYRAKSMGKNVYAVYDASFELQALSYLDAQADLRRGIEEREITAYFQPVISLVDRRIIGAEALARWRHPERGLVMPGDFIPLAEEMGLISDLFAQVLDISLRQSRLWRSVEGGALPIAVNLSPRQICEDRFEETLLAALRRHGVAPHDIILEITENSLVTDTACTIAVLRRLRHAGFRIAIDDFGVGHSSLSYLKDLSLDILKIDHSFVESIDLSEHDARITASITELARALGLTLVVEGVEREKQAEKLLGCGCTSAQGFLFAPALPSKEFSSLLVAMTPVSARSKPLASSS